MSLKIDQFLNLIYSAKIGELACMSRSAAILTGLLLMFSFQHKTRNNSNLQLICQWGTVNRSIFKVDPNFRIIKITIWPN